MTEGITPLAPSIAKTNHDKLQLPNGRKLGDESNLFGVLMAAGVPNVSAAHGRSTLANIYAGHLELWSKVGDGVDQEGGISWG